MKQSKKEKNNGEAPTLDDMLLDLDSRLDGLIEVVTKSKSNGRYIVGFKKGLFLSKVRIINTSLDDLNQLMKAYCDLLTDRTVGRELLDEILSLNLADQKNFELEVKKQYFKLHRIQIPSFPNFKIEKLIDSYEFPQDDVLLIDQILEKAKTFCSSVPGGKVNDYDFKQYFDESYQSLVMSEALEDELIDQFTVYASERDIAEIVFLHLLSKSLTGLSVSYSIEDLPEIDFRLMGLLTISNGMVSVNTERIKEIRGLYPGHDLDIQMVSSRGNNQGSLRE